ELDPTESAAFTTLENWDYNMSKDEVAPAVFEFFTKSFAKNLLSDELGDLYDKLPASVSDYYIFHVLKTGPDQWVDDVNTPQAETLDDIIFRSFKDEVRTLSSDYGHDPDKWTWGRIHTISLEHPLGVKKILDRIFKLNSHRYPIGGSNHTVCPYSYTTGFRVNDGASERHIFNTADWDESYTVIPDGNSGVPSSEFYLSQTKTYLEGGFYRDAFSDEAVKAGVRYTLKLVPSN
ncbi:MAG: penicillin acylase family protein, partial [Bacteroidota bacterium]|nr:penicillin acylase family protein [Bacteroidota bacterium]